MHQSRSEELTKLEWKDFFSGMFSQSQTWIWVIFRQYPIRLDADEARNFKHKLRGTLTFLGRRGRQFEECKTSFSAWVAAPLVVRKWDVKV